MSGAVVDVCKGTLIFPYCFSHERLLRNGMWEGYPKDVMVQMLLLPRHVVVTVNCDFCGVWSLLTGGFVDAQAVRTQGAVT
jgi:hypothetical protein